LRCCFHSATVIAANISMHGGLAPLIAIVTSRRTWLSYRLDGAFQREIPKFLHDIDSAIVKDRDEFERRLDAAVRKADARLPAGHARRSFRPSANATKRLRSAVTMMALRRQTPSFAIPRAFPFRQVAIS
jgi:hypothetical protein